MTGAPPRSAGASPESQVRAVADDYVDRLAAVDPRAAQALGRVGRSALPRVAPEDFDARREIGDRAAAALSRAVRDDSSPAAADLDLAAALGERLAADALLDDSGFTQRLLAPLATPVQDIRGVFDAMPLATDDDAARMAAELRRVPAALDGYRETLRRAAGRGHRSARRQVEVVAAQCRDWCDPGGSDFFRGLGRTAATTIESPTATRALDEAVALAAGAFSGFAGFLTEELLPDAPTTDGVGRDRYAITARAFLGDDVDLDETVDWGWAELARIEREIDATARQIHPDGLGAAAAALDSDPRRRVTGSAEIEAWLTGSVADIADRVDGAVVDLPAAGRLPRCLVSRSGSGVMYYDEPDPGLTRPGTIWWATEPGRPVHTWRERTTVLHEGIPGHHLQIGTALTTPGLHPWQRALCHIHGYAEGWAHYSESWSGEIGLLDDPAERLGMLLGQAWRAARIVIDAGLHLDLPIPPGAVPGADRWTYPVAVAFLQRVTGLGTRMASFEVDRYLGWPAQALSFRVGARLFADIVDTARRRPGFDERSFHTDLLRRGPMGLAALRERMGAQPVTQRPATPRGGG